MKIGLGEQQAIRTVVELAREFGYGNMIAHLQAAWAQELVESGFPEDEAQEHAGGPGYPIQMHLDMIERGEWDETGQRYKWGV